MPAFEVCRKHMRIKNAFWWSAMAVEYLSKLLAAHANVFYVPCDFCKMEEEERWPGPPPRFLIFWE